MREKVIEKYLHRQVTAAGGTTRKFKSPNHPNVPDRIVIWPRGECNALVHFIELKAPGENLRPAQAREMQRLANKGCYVNTFSAKSTIDAYVGNYR